MSLLLALTGGVAPTSYALTCDAGAYTYTGQAATLKLARRLTCAVGAYVYTGQAATLTVARRLTGAAGSYSYTGQAATLTVGRRLSLATGAYTYTGNAATLKVGRILSLAAGSYAYTGKAADLTYTSGSNVPFTAGGSGYPVWQKKPKATASNSIDKLWDLVLEDYYKGILDKAPTSEKKKAAAIVRPYADKAGKAKSIPAPSQIDWAAVEANSAEVSALLKLWQEQVLNRQIDDEDEFLLLMME